MADVAWSAFWCVSLVSRVCIQVLWGGEMTSAMPAENEECIWIGSRESFGIGRHLLWTWFGMHHVHGITSVIEHNRFLNVSAIVMRVSKLKTFCFDFRLEIMSLFQWNAKWIWEFTFIQCLVWLHLHSAAWCNANVSTWVFRMGYKLRRIYFIDLSNIIQNDGKANSIIINHNTYYMHV